jgi:hypothetical protein
MLPSTNPQLVNIQLRPICHRLYRFVFGEHLGLDIPVSPHKGAIYSFPCTITFLLFFLLPPYSSVASEELSNNFSTLRMEFSASKCIYGIWCNYLGHAGMKCHPSISWLVKRIFLMFPFCLGLLIRCF